jgi:putative Ca2+/H+ antiporter (TMEM165/GDT1 family)
MAIFLGKYLSSRIDRRVITRVGGVVFLLIGLSFLLSAVTSSAFAEIL